MKWLRDEWKAFLAYLAFGLGVSLALGLCLVKFREEIAEPFLTHVDAAVMQALHVDATPGLTLLMKALTWIGSPLVIGPVVALATGSMWWKGYRRQAVLMLLTIGGAGLLDVVMKLYFRRNRPDVPWAILHEHSFSFPSGHSVEAFALYGMLLYLLLKQLQRAWQKTIAVVAALVLAFGIGLSRIYLGVHYPSDVAAGYFVGGVWVLAVIAADLRRNRALAGGGGPRPSLMEGRGWDR